MAFTKIHLTILIVSISILFAPTTHATFAPIAHAVGAGASLTTQTHIFKMCKTTSYPLLCYKSLLPKALVTPRFNIYRALEVEVQAAQAQVVKTVTSIAYHLVKPGTTKDTVDCLAICKDQFSMIVDSVTEAVAALSKRNVGEVQYKLSAVVSYYLSCNLGFEESEIRSPIEADAKAVNDLSTNCLDLAKIIVNKRGKVKSG